MAEISATGRGRTFDSGSYIYICVVTLNELRDITAIFVFTDCVKNVSVGMHSDIYESICMFVDAIVLCILIQVLVTLTLIQGHGNVRKQQLLPAAIISQFLIDLNWFCLFPRYKLQINYFWNSHNQNLRINIFTSPVANSLLLQN